MNDFNLAENLEKKSTGLAPYINIETFKDDPWEKDICTLANAYAERAPLTYAVDGLFAFPSLNIIFGNPGSIKSLFAGDCAIHVSGGLPWLDRTVKQSAVLWIDLDNGKRRTHERFEALGRKAKLFIEVPFYYVSMKPFNAANVKDIKNLTQRMIALGIKFLVIDNLGLISPGADENSNDMILIMANLRALSETTGAAIVLIHHQRKTQSTTRAGETLRGHSSIESATDLCLLVEREADSNIIKVKSTKSRDIEVYPFAAEFCFTHKEDTPELYEAWFESLEIEDTTSDHAIEKAILSVVEDTPLINQKNLIEGAKPALQAGIKRIRLVLAALVKKGKIKTKEGAHGAKLYVIE